MAAECGDAIVGGESSIGRARSAVGGDDVAEEGFFGGESSLVLHLEEDLLHLVEHLRSSELGDDEIVGEGAVAEGFLGGVRVRESEELESEVRVFLEAKKRRETERGDVLQILHRETMEGKQERRSFSEVGKWDGINERLDLTRSCWERVWSKGVRSIGSVCT